MDSLGIGLIGEIWIAVGVCCAIGLSLMLASATAAYQRESAKVSDD